MLAVYTKIEMSNPERCQHSVKTVFSLEVSATAPIQVWTSFAT